MNEQQVINLFKKIQSANPETKWTLEKLKEKLQTKEKRKELYENETYKKYLSDLGISIGGTLEEFEKTYGTSVSNPKPTKSKFTEVNIKPEEVCNGKTVSEGMKGDIVWIIQNQLKVSPLTRNFGSKTKAAVVNFQNNHKDKLTIDGSVGPKTWSLMFEGTQYACKKVDSIPAITASTATTINNVTPPPPKPKKQLKPLDVISPEKYTGRIGEQVEVDDNVPASNVNPVVDAKPQTVQPKKTEDPVQILKRVINTGCLNSLKKEIGFELYGRPESQPRKLKDNTYAIVGINTDNQELIYLFSDGKGKKVKVDDDNSPIQGQTEDIEWECAGFKKSTSLTADNNQMTADQQQFVEDIVARGNGYYRTEMPSGYDEGQGAWKRTDLSTVPGGERLFKPNTFFVWAKTGVVGKRQDYVEKVTKFLEKTGWSFDEPDVTSAAFKNGVLLGNKFPEYRDYFRADQKIWYVGKTYSGEEQTQALSIADKIKSDAGAELKREFCKAGVDVLYDAVQNPTKVYFNDDSDLELVKNYVKRCERELRPNAMSNLLGGSRKKFEYLKANRSGTKGALRFFLGEEKNNLNSLIKKKLVEAKSKKEDDLIGKQLIENRLKMIVDSVKKKENNLEKISMEFLNELKELNTQGLLNENLGDSLKNIFGGDLQTMPQTFFESIFDRVLNKVGLNDESLKKKLVDSAKTNPMEIVEAFKDCDSMTELIAKTITDVLYMNLQSGQSLKGEGWNLIRSILGQEIKKEDFMKKIKSSLNSKVCQEFSNLTSNSQSLLSKIKGVTI